ncbi:MAG: arylsulfatase [Pirellulaceae bacterium]
MQPTKPLRLILYFALMLSLQANRAKSADTAAAPVHPNVIVLLSDDQGWGDLSLNGNTDIETPNIDSLGKQGIQFDRFYVCAVCSPTRAEFLTGRYHARGGVYSTSAGGERLNLDEVTIADTFHAAGYATAAFGKWHNGMQYPYHPNGRGFDEFYGFCSGHWGDYFNPLLERNGQLTKGDGFCIDDFTNQAIHFIEQSVQEKRPFFTYLPFNTPHSPMQVPDRFWDRFANKSLEQKNRDPQRQDVEHTKCALAMCENIDWNVGRILGKLSELQIAENTIVVYFCDNGPNGWRWNGGMKGRKGSTDEGGVRSPLLIRWPGQLQPRTIKQIASATDLLPTLAELCQADLSSSKPLDGKSLVPLLTGNRENPDWPDRIIINQWRNKLSARNQRFRLSTDGQLYDIAQDPGQKKDVSHDFPAVVAKLKTALERHSAEVAGYDQDSRPFPLGNQEFRYTQVPARDGKVVGGIKRSNRYPNCSFFTHWTSDEDVIFWEVDVMAPGRYQVEAMYSCSAEDIGSTVQLSCGASQLNFQITEPHDPPLRGQEHDRVERTESYIKDFRTSQLGTIELASGPQKLQLRAIDIAGQNVMDFRLLQFTRLGD